MKVLIVIFTALAISFAYLASVMFNHGMLDLIAFAQGNYTDMMLLFTGVLHVTTATATAITGLLSAAVVVIEVKQLLSDD